MTRSGGSEKFELLKKLIYSKNGAKHFEKLFDDFKIDEDEADDEKLKSRLLDKIHGKISVEELISNISNEHKRQQKMLDKSRRPAKKLPTKKVLLPLFVLVILMVAFFVSKEDLKSREATPSVTYISKSTSKGQKLTIHLADGTKVILNSRSSIKYPESFGDSIREVYVQGEAFFEVTHNTHKPFLVHSGTLTSKVLGTSFNIRYWPEDHINTVALVTGKVQVSLDKENNREKSVVLVPGESMELNTLQGTFVKQSFDVEKVVGWKDNIIFFSDANYHEVFETLENWYGVDIEIANENNNVIWHLSAKFENENLENILNALMLSQDIKYEIDGKKVKVRL